MLINTAGFLQSKSQQTGEESSAQVTNQLQVVSKTGVVATGGGGENSVNRLVINDQSQAAAAVVGTAATASGGTDFSSGSPDNSLTVVDSGGTQVSGANTIDDSAAVLEFEVVNTSAFTVTNTNADPNTVLTVDLSEGQSLSGANDVTISGGSLETNGTVAIGTSDTVFSIETVTPALTLGSNSEITVTDGGSFTIQAPSDTVEVTNTDTSGSVTFEGDNSELEVDVEITGEDGFLDLTNDNNYQLTGPSGNSISITSKQGDNGGVQFGSEVTVLNGADQFTVAADTDLSAETAAYVSAGSGTSEAVVDQIDLVVLRGAGAGDIDMSGTIISFTGPDGSETLTFDESTATAGETFTLKTVQDEDDTAPVLSSGDRFKLVIDPGTLESGESADLRITTQSGATKVVQVRIPDSLANKEAVNL